MIAKITSGGSFRGVLDYLLNPKKEQQEGEQSRAQKHRQEQLREAGRITPSEATGRDGTRPRDDENREELSGTKRQQKQSHIGGRDSHPEHARDLTDDYETGQRHRIIGGNLSGQNPRQLAREFGLVRELRPDIEKPVHHVSISAGKNDRLSVEQWQEIAGDYIERMGFQNCPHIVIQHRGTERDHIHLVVSRIDEDGKVISEWQSKRRAEKVMREVEHKYNLEHVPMSREAIRATPTRAEREVFERTGRMSAKMSLQGHVERALRDQPTATEFIEKLQRIGVQAIPNLQSTGRVSGISFRQGEELMKGSDLGRGLSWGALQKRGLSYDPERDRTAIEIAWQRAEMSRTGAQTIALPTPEPQHATAFTAQDVDRLAGQYLLDQALNLEPSKDSRDALERLNTIAGIERPDPATTSDLISDRAPEASLTLDVAVEREAQEQVIEWGLELSL